MPPLKTTEIKEYEGAHSGQEWKTQIKMEKDPWNLQTALML